jgi:hypothetical protein
VWTPQDWTIALDALGQVQELLLKQAAYREPGYPNLDSPVPLFSPMCGTMMLDDWCSLRDALYMVHECCITPSNEFLNEHDLRLAAGSSRACHLYRSSMYLVPWISAICFI